MERDSEIDEIMRSHRESARRSDGIARSRRAAWQQAVPDIVERLRRFEPQLKDLQLNPTANYGDEYVHLTLYPEGRRDQIVVRYSFDGEKVITEMSADGFQTPGDDDVEPDAGRPIEDITDEAIASDVRTAMRRLYPA